MTTETNGPSPESQESAPPPPPDNVPTDQAAPSTGRPLSRWQLLSFGATHAFLATLLAITSLGTLARLARAFGTLEWCVNFKRRRRFARALDAVTETPLPPQERRRVTREHFIRTRCDKLFYLVFDCIPHDRAAALFTIKNQPLIDDAIQRGRGVYIALSHHGAHHVAAMLMVVRGYKVAGVRDRNEGGLRRYVQGRLDRLHPEFRQMRVIFADAYPREIYRCLRDGFVLGSAMDVHRVRHANQKVEEFTLFGQTRPFISGPLRVAARCGATVLQAFIVARGDFRYELDITGVLLDPDDIDNEDQAVHEGLEKYARTIEGYIRAHPALLSRL